jgi:hypothetical protein
MQSPTNFLVQVARLPLGPKLMVLGTLVVAVAVLTVVLTFDSMGPPEPLHSALGSAVVQAEETALLSTADGTAKELMKLKKGAKVNLLDKLSSLDVPVVRVQFVNQGRNSKPGFVRTQDLGAWESNDPVSEWAFLSASRNRSEVSTEEFITKLRSYSLRFPGSSESEKALLERAGLHLKIAKAKQAAGKPKEEWEPDIAQAREAVSGLSSAIANSADVVAMVKEFDMVQPAAAAAAPPASTPAAEPPKDDAITAQLRILLRNAKAAWDSGDLRGCESNARKALSISPNNTAARGFLYQVQKAREALK